MTLIEMLVTIAIIAVVSISLGKVIQNFYRTNAYTLQQSQAVDSARKGVSSAMQDLREASYGDDGSYPIASAATSSITFYSNVDGDTAVEKVRYYLSSATLYRGVTNSVGSPPSYAGQGEATSTIAGHVVNASTTPATAVFRYFDSAGLELSSPFNISQIASVQTTVLVDFDPNRSPTTFTLAESATLRNVRSGQ
jgi:prepilin-type N-terminal cleavage/methylation domain-containing protein